MSLTHLQQKYNIQDKEELYKLISFCDYMIDLGSHVNPKQGEILTPLSIEYNYGRKFKDMKETEKAFGLIDHLVDTTYIPHVEQNKDPNMGDR